MKNIFISGNNIDKGTLDAVEKDVARDPAIRRLIFLGNSMLYRHIGGIFVVVVLFYLNYRSALDSPVRLPTNIAGVLLAALTLASAASDIKELRESCMTLGSYWKYTISKTRPKHPLDIWHYIPGSVSDLQIVHVADTLLNHRTEVMYTGAPYYETRYIDSITIRWAAHSRPSAPAAHLLEHIRQLCFFRKYFRDYAERNMIAHAKDEYFKENNKHIECSNMVFGILFASGYLHAELKRQNCSRPVNIQLDLRGEDRVRKTRLAREWLHYCIPACDVASLAEDTKCPDFTVVDIATDANFSSKHKFRKKLAFSLHEITIPVKRFIAFPTENALSPDSGISLPYCGDGGSEARFFLVGGAEQNLALQYAITQNQWKKCPGIYVGFAENAFEEGRTTDFLVGTEGLVYGITQNVTGRQQAKAETTCRAEVYCMRYNRQIIYNVYGYHAMATKISICMLLRAIQKGDSGALSYIPGRAVKEVDLLTYQTIGSRISNHAVPPDGGGCKIYNTELGKNWDSSDLMNHPERLAEVLDQICEEQSDVSCS